MINFNQKEEKIPDEFRKISKDFTEKGFITTSSENLINDNLASVCGKKCVI